MVIGLLCLGDISINKVKSTDQRAFQNAVVVRLEKARGLAVVTAYSGRGKKRTKKFTFRETN